MADIVVHFLVNTPSDFLLMCYGYTVIVVGAGTFFYLFFAGIALLAQGKAKIMEARKK